MNKWFFKTLLLIFICVFTYFDVNAFVKGNLEYYPLSETTCEVCAIDETLSGSIVIPSQVEWTDEQGITHVYKVIRIGDFADCRITDVKIPESVTTISGYAFYETHLTEITIPKSVETIGNSAFKNCQKLNKVTFGDGLKSIGYDVFSGCIKLEAVFMSSLKLWCELDWGEVNIGGAPLSTGAKLYIGGKLIEGHLKIPDGVSKIGINAFVGYKAITSVEIPSSVTSIGSSAFSGEYLKSVVVGTGVKEIASDIFGYAPTADLFPEKVIWLPKTQPTVHQTPLGSMGNSRGRTNYVCSEQYKLSGYVKCYTHLNDRFVVDGVVYVPTDYQTATCDVIDCRYESDGLLPKLVIPSSVNRSWYEVFRVENIARSAFYKCETVITADLHNNGNINFKAFYGCTNLSSVTLDNDGTVGEIVSSTKIPDGLDREETKVYTAGVFQACPNLSDVTICTPVKLIGDNTFNECASLSSLLVFSQEEPLYFGIDTFSNSPLFAGCPLKTVHSYRDITYSDVSPFYVNMSLSTVVLDDGVHNIPARIFYRCAKLKSIKLHEGLNTIGDASFYGCPGPSTLTVPASVTAIGANAFENDSSSCVKTLILGDRLEKIGYRAFYGANGLAEIFSMSQIPPVCSDDVFSREIVKTCRLYVPEKSMDLYKEAYVWRDFLNISAEQSGVNQPICNKQSVNVVYIPNGFRLTGLSADDNVTVYDVSGRMVSSQKGRNEYILPDGLYIVKTLGSEYKVRVK